MNLRSALIALAALTATTAVALDPTTAISQYGRRTWRLDDGLPQSSVHATAQTPDGYLWVGTQQGLARFDGVRFTTIALANSDQGVGYVSSLITDRDGVLWIGTDKHGLLRVAGEELVIDAQAAKAGVTDIFSMDRARDGSLWMATNVGIVSRAPNGVITRQQRSSGGPADAAHGVLMGRDGVVWLGLTDGVAKLVDGRVQRVSTLPAVRSMFHDKRGTIWIGTSAGLYRVKGDAVAKVPALGSAFIGSIREDERGNLWIGTNQGLKRLAGGKLESFTDADGLAGAFVVSLFEDSERTLWIGTLTGLTQLRDTPFIALGKAQGIRDDVVLTVHQDPTGTIWMGTTAGLGRLRDGKMRWYSTADGLSNATVFAITDANAGDGGGVWVGTYGGGACHVSESVRCYDRRAGLSHDMVRSALRDSRGRLWFGTLGGGLNLMQNGKITSFGEESGFESLRVMSIREARDGGLWIGHVDGGLVHFAKGRVTGRNLFGLSTPTVRSVIEEPDGTLWISTIGAGLFRWKHGRMFQYPVRRFGVDDYMYQLVDDQAGALWISTNRGIARFTKNELHAFADGKSTTLKPTIFGTDNGLPSWECNGGNPGGIRTADGKLWFATINGLAVIDPLRIRAATEPKALIENIEVDGVRMHGALRLSPGTERVTFQFTAPVFTNPKRIRFRYRLAGFDRRWMNAGTSRTATYTNLPPGRYSFEVMADVDGTWSARSMDSVAIERVPALRETRAFALLCIAVTALVLCLAYRARVSVLRNRQAELERVVQERTSSLHDANESLRRISITDSLTGIFNRRHFDDHLTSEWKRAMRGGDTVSLILFDVDFFKRFNDRYGHTLGDDCLAAVAKAAASTVSRAGDLVARYGGEEFVVVLAGGGGHWGAMCVAEEIRRRILALAIPHAASLANPHITVSLGVATFVPRPGQEPLALVQRADRALYAAKEQGRNRVSDGGEVVDVIAA